MIVSLPIGPRGADGLPLKQGADDFIVRYGEAEFRRFIERATSPPRPPRSLDDYRSEMALIRRQSIRNPGIYLDTSPTGAGKTYADLSAAAICAHSLMVVPTHKNCEEVRDLYARAGLDAEAFPQIKRDTCAAYDEAITCIESGLSASTAVCPVCKHKENCDYQDSLEAAEAAAHQSATQQRARYTLEHMAEGKQYIAIHEEPLGVLRPIEEISSGLERVAEVARIAKDRAPREPDLTFYHFFYKMEQAAHWLAEKLKQTDNTIALPVSPAACAPIGADVRLFRVMRAEGEYTPAATMRIVHALAAGELCELVVRVDRVHAKAGEVTTHRSIIGVWQTKLPDDAAVWLCDATADANEIENIVGRPVVNKTPEGRLERQHDVSQIAVDVKLSTSPRVVTALLRGILTAFPEPQRIGVICHKKHVPLIRGTAHGPVLDEPLRRRIAKIEHYRSGEGRGSNKWIDECDMILVLGTPRVPPPAVKLRLIQTGRAAAAARDGRWDRDYWSGITTSGQRRTIRTSAYRDHDWHSANCALVRSELHQAIGRGRGICPNGVPVLVVTNEPLGLPILEIDVQPVSETAMKVLQAIRDLSEQNPKGESAAGLSEQNPKIYLLGKCSDKSVCSLSIAASLKITDRHVRSILNDLSERHLVERIGERGGWVLTIQGSGLLSAGTHNHSSAAGPAPATPLLTESTHQDAAQSTQGTLDGSTVKSPPDAGRSDSGGLQGQSCQQVTGATASAPAPDLQAALAKLWQSEPAAKADQGAAVTPTPAVNAETPHPNPLPKGEGTGVLPPALGVRSSPALLPPLPPGAVGSGMLDRPCRCGSTEYAEMPISEGRTRRDCGKCGRFAAWGKWYDQGGPTP